MSRLRRLAHRLERRQSKLELRQELVQQRLLRLCPPQLPVSNQLLVARMEQLAELVLRPSPLVALMYQEQLLDPDPKATLRIPSGNEPS